MTEAAADPPERSSSPYRGLRPYEETDAAFFFGREAEGENVEANLFSTRLTLLYGPSGVGKSSVLLAGVTGSLRKRSREDVESGAAARFAVVVVRSWSDADPLERIAVETRRAVTKLLEDEALPDPPAGATLAEVLDHWSVQVHGKLLVLFDQFEEYFLYHGQESGPGTFDHEFPEAVNRPDLRANFLLSIRDDALAQLDRFKGRIPSLFDNRLQIEHLTVAAARDAVTKPIDEYNRHVPPEQWVEVEEELVNDVLDQVRTERVTRESAGAGAVREAPAAGARVETPILQVVLTSLWEREAELGSRTLHAQTLRDLGGATQLLGDRLNERMQTLGPGEQDIAANVARYLVTPSGTKIALTAADLTQLAYENPDLSAADQARVESVLQRLAEGDTRILRPVKPLGGKGATRYELFHDVLADPILEWRRGYEQGRSRRAARRRLFRVGGAALVLVVAFGALAVAAVQSRNDAIQAKESANRLTSLALSSLAENLFNTDPDASLLLSLEANRVQATPQAKRSMLAELAGFARSGQVAILRAGQSPLFGVAFSPDGSTLAAAGDDGEVVLWDAAHDYRKLTALDSGGQSAVYGVAFSPDGSTLAAAGSQGKVVLWDAHDYRKLTALESGQSAVYGVAFSPDGSTLAAAGSQGKVVLWDAAHDYRKLTALKSGQRAVLGVAFSPDGSTLAAAGSQGKVVLWDAHDYRKLTALESGQRAVDEVAFSPDGSTLAAAGDDGEVVLWDAAHDYRKLTALDSGGQSAVYGVAFSPDGSTLAAAGSQGKVVLWDAHDYRKLTALESGQSAVYKVAFSPDGSTLAAPGHDGKVVLWDAAHGYGKLTALESGQPALDGVAFAFSPDGSTLAAAGSQGKVVLWDAAHDYRKLTALESGQSAVYKVAFSPDGSTLAAAGSQGKVVLWDAAHDYRKLTALKSGQRAVLGVAFSPDGSTLAAAGSQGKVVLWDAAHDYRKLTALKSGRRAVYEVAFSPDGSTLAAPGDDGKVVLWDAAHDYRKLTALKSDQRDVLGVAFSPDGSTLAAAGYQGKLVLWDAAHDYRKLTALALDSPQSVWEVAFSPDGSTLAAAGDDGKVVLWDAAHDYSELTALKSGQRAVYGVAFSPDGSTLAAGAGSAGGAGEVVLWDFFWRDFPELKAKVCGLVHGNLTKAEWRTVAPGFPYRTTCPD